MAVRRFGPVLGAGVQIVEQEPEQLIQASPLGVTVKVGEFEKGPLGEPQFLSGAKAFARRNGGRIENGDAPKAAQDFYRLGRGAGELITYRVASTTVPPVQSELTLYNRQGVTGSTRAAALKLKAKNGGKWGGKRRVYIDEHTGVGDLTATTLDTGDTMVENEWAGGTLDLKKVTTKTYRIVGNTAAGVISVEADQDLATDFAAGGGSPANRYVLTRENLDYLDNDKHLAAKVKNGVEDPSGEWGLEIYVDGELVLDYQNLSSDPVQPNYFVNVINDDPSNYEIVASDLFTGDKTVASVRPMNWYGESKALATTVLTLPDADVLVTSGGGANPTVAHTYGASQKRAVITGTVENSGADIRYTVDIGPATFNVLQATFTGVPTDLGPELGTVTVTNGGTPLADGDTVTLTVLALVPDEAIGGKVWPDIVNKPNLSFTITDNAAKTVTVRTGLDLTDGGTISSGADFQINFEEEMGLGNNGADVVDNDYLPAFDVNLSTLNKIVGKNKGLVKITSPAVTSTAITKAGLEYAAAKNWQYRVEFPANITDEDSAVDHINTTIGRSDYGVCHFPSFGSIQDPDTTPGAANAALKQQSMIGMILGREALVARNYDGYHKAPAGIDVTLPDILELPTGDAETASVLNEEILNPQGINVIKFRQGNVIVWGDRTISPTTSWKFHHQRALMSYYENVLRENFDYIVFAINNPDTQERIKTTLRAYFLPEFIKGALRGDKFEGDAFQLKIDEENNTDATRAMGDLNAEIILRLADTVERFRITLGKAGIFDAVV